MSRKLMADLGALLASALLANVAAAISVDVSAGLDADTRHLIEGLAPNAVAALENSVQRLRPEVKEDVKEYTEFVRLRVYELLGEARCTAEATAHHTGRDIFGRFNAITDLDDARTRIAKQVNGASSPAEVDSAYVAFISAAQVDLCDVKGDVDAQRYIGQSIDAAKRSDRIWYNLRDLKCPRADGCFAALLAGTQKVLATADPADLRQTRAADRLKGIAPPSTSMGSGFYHFVTRSFDFSPFEQSYGDLFAVQGSIKESADKRHGAGVAALQKAQHLLSESTDRLNGANGAFSAASANICADQEAAIHKNQSLQELTDGVTANNEMLKEELQVVAVNTPDFKTEADDVQATSTAMGTVIGDLNARAKSEIEKMMQNKKSCEAQRLADALRSNSRPGVTIPGTDINISF
jgi:hypothetical protein